MSVGAPLSLKDSTLTLVGAGVGESLEVPFVEAGFSFEKSNPVQVIYDRGTIKGHIKLRDAEISGSLTIKMLYTIPDVGDPESPIQVLEFSNTTPFTPTTDGGYMAGLDWQWLQDLPGDDHDEMVTLGKVVVESLTPAENDVNTWTIAFRATGMTFTAVT